MKSEDHQGHAVWQSSTSKFGIHGARVAVDLDGCNGCLKCFRVCPVDVFTQWAPDSKHIKADPVKEADCLECLACELVCPVDVIHITRTPPTGDTLSALLD